MPRGRIVVGKEATSWEWLRNGITKELPAYSLLERVENGLSAGMADVNYVIRSVEGWIEMKATTLPARADTAVLGDEKGLRKPEQVNWHVARHRVNGRTWVFVTAKPFRWLVSGVYARDINQWTAEEFNKRARISTSANWTAKEWGLLIKALSNQ